MGYEYSAIRLDNFILIIGGVDRAGTPLSTRVIWTHNLYTQQWRRHVIPDIRPAPNSFYSAVAVAIDGSIYTYGGISVEGERNELWTLSRSETGGFTWSIIDSQCKKESPSPRYGHTGWEYAGKLWVFGGAGPSAEGYLNCHGDIASLRQDILVNNQLLSYDPNTTHWVSPQCFGSVPSPRWKHASAIIKANVFLFGGCIQNRAYTDNFYQLDMNSLTWTQLRIGHPRPQACSFSSLTATSNNQLVLHGGQSTQGALNDTWVMDLTSYSWRLYTSCRYLPRRNHTAILGVSSNIIIIGGCKDRVQYIGHVMLEPKSLKELASCTVYRHLKELPWKSCSTDLCHILDLP